MSVLYLTDDAGCQARLVTRQQDGMLQITGFCRNTTAKPVSIRYELLASREGQTGTSSNMQSGTYIIKAAGEQALSQTSISFSPMDTCRVYLRLFSEQGQLLAQDSVVQQPESHQ